MRISDWSSDVCSSDLDVGTVRRLLDLARDADPRIHARGGRRIPQGPAEGPALRRSRLDREPGVRADPPDLWPLVRPAPRNDAAAFGPRPRGARADGI